MPRATNCRVMTYREELPLIKLHDPLFTLFCETTRQIKGVLSPLLQCLKPPNLWAWWRRGDLNKFDFTWPFQQVITWGHVCQIENIKLQLSQRLWSPNLSGLMIYLAELPPIKAYGSFNHMVLWFWFALLQLVDSDGRRLSHHRLLFTFVIFLLTKLSTGLAFSLNHLTAKVRCK